MSQKKKTSTGKTPSRFKNIFHFLKRHRFLSALSLFIIFLVVFIAYLAQGMPSLTQLENIEPPLVTRLYSEDGKVIHELFIHNRIYVSFEKIPDHTIQALLDTEDREFYQHWGINLKRVPKAIFIDLISMSFRQGFSTITMQLARNLYFGFQKNLVRKFREILTAIQIERTYSKQEILEMYLNMAFFGHGTYGIQSASKKYFGRDVSELSIDESAVLVAMLKGPNRYSPIKYPQRVIERRNLVLYNMLVCGNLTEAEFDSLKGLPIVLRKTPEYSSMAPYFTEYVRIQLNQLQDSLNVNVYKDGLNVYTTLNSTIQACMDSAIKKHMPKLQEEVTKSLQKWKEENNIPDSLFEKKSQVQIGFMAMNPRNGHILAMTGGRDFENSQYNRATQAARQPGSAFKPFLYAAAIDNGYTPADKILNQPVVINNPDGTRWDPENFDKTFGGLTTLREALRHSLNLVSARLILEIGPSVVVDYAHRMGITTNLRPFPTLALGSSEVYLKDLVNAYGVFANQGVLVEPIAITRIEDRHGNVIYESRPRHKEVLSRATSYILTNMLEDVINHGTGGSARWKYHFNAPAAGKTGTTDNYTDAWFVGFTPLIAAGVWVGLDAPELKLGRGQTGSRAALPFWADFMKAVYDTLKLPQETFKQPPEVISLDICTESGKIATNFCPKVVTEVFNIKYHPTEQCDIHTKPRMNSKKSKFLF
ncbi:MAG: penicillin-binding protein 1A [Calditrichia bacterium]